MTVIDPLHLVSEAHTSGFDEFVSLFPRIISNLPAFSTTLNGVPCFVELLSLNLSKCFNNINELNQKKFIYPRECRVKGSTYRANIHGTFSLTINDQKVVITRSCGTFPVCVKSQYCSLSNLNPKQLLKVGEDPREPGGYYIINGIERILRLEIAPIRNCWLSIMRDSFCLRGANFSKYAVQARCVGPDETGHINVLHYLSDGSVVMRVSYCNRSFFVPLMVVLKALADLTDEEIFDMIAIDPSEREYESSERKNFPNSDTTPIDSNKFEISDLNETKSDDRSGVDSQKILDFQEKGIQDSKSDLSSENIKRVRNLLKSFDRSTLRTQTDCIIFLGSKFKVIFNEFPYNDLQAGAEFLFRLVTPHISDGYDKALFLASGVRRLYFLVDNKIPTDLDALSSQELYTPTQVLCTAMKDQLFSMILKMCRQIARRNDREKAKSKPAPGTRRRKPKNKILLEREHLHQSDIYTTDKDSLESKNSENFSENEFSSKNEDSSDSLSLSQKGNPKSNSEMIQKDKNKRNPNPTSTNSTSQEKLAVALAFAERALTEAPADLTIRFEHLLATGNLAVSRSSDLTERSGHAVFADRINFFRFIAHFASINRGNFFAQLKTTAVRKLRPESLGFICPVHTPDGAPCGIITHLSTNCRVVVGKMNFPTTVLCSLGMFPVLRNFKGVGVEVFLDGKVVGYVKSEFCIAFVRALRKLRSLKSLMVEILYIPKGGFLFPGIYLRTTGGRLARGVLNSENRIEMIGPLEQVFLHINQKKHQSGKDMQSLQPNGNSTVHAVEKNQENRNSGLDPSDGDLRCGNEDFPGENTCDKSKDSLCVITNNLTDNLSNNCELEDPTDALVNELIRKKVTDSIFEKNLIEFTNTVAHSNTIFESYSEISKTGFLSLIAAITPFSDYNQSPRNMYQCQMAKQTMGIPFLNDQSRADSKSYKILYPQKPLIATKTYNKYALNNFPMGINAIIAVLSYTAYDMEDAMVINNASTDRGLFHGSILKTERITLKDNEQLKSTPKIGSIIKTNDKLYTLKASNGDLKDVLYRGSETARVDSVRMFQNKSTEIIGFAIVLRIERNPSIGDKFCSRHGQKGVCSSHFKSIDMPFTNDGICPDIIINPHAFPSRMTIGMLIESMAGKVACLTGKAQDGTPFQKTSSNFSNVFTHHEKSFDDLDGNLFIKSQSESEDQSSGTKSASDPNKDSHDLQNNTGHNTNKNEQKTLHQNIESSSDGSLLEFFGDQLTKYGYNYYGNETMFSGITGHQFTAQIFSGVVYYQRLRHMVLDKYQVRTTGKIQPLTNQPTGGRKRKGGIRLGEMERDALIAHGTSSVLHDRLMVCSDGSVFRWCSECKSIMFSSNGECICGSTSFRDVSLPYVFRYLCAELIAMNISVTLDL